MNDLIIVGGSPFVNTVDLHNLDYTKYDVLAINKQPYGIPVKYLLGVDEIILLPHLKPSVFYV